MMFSNAMQHVAQFPSRMRECVNLMRERDVDGGIQRIPEHNLLARMALVVDP
jgi:hypothetical protein